jgi:hypothetical protein
MDPLTEIMHIASRRPSYRDLVTHLWPQRHQYPNVKGMIRSNITSARRQDAKTKTASS